MGNGCLRQRPDASNFDAVMYRKGTRVEIRPQRAITEICPVDAIDIDSRSVTVCFGNRVPGVDTMKAVFDVSPVVSVHERKGKVSFTANTREGYNAILAEAKGAGIKIPDGFTGLAEKNLPSCWPAADRPASGAGIAAA